MKSDLAFDKWVEVKPCSVPPVTGCGIIVEVVYDNLSQCYLYTVLTDFGNTFKFPQYEMDIFYTPTYKCTFPHTRMQKQLDLLYEAQVKYFKEEEDGEC